jgi:hypothetical protein
MVRNRTTLDNIKSFEIDFCSELAAIRIDRKSIRKARNMIRIFAPVATKDNAIKVSRGIIPPNPAARNSDTSPGTGNRTILLVKEGMLTKIR